MHDSLGKKVLLLLAAFCIVFAAVSTESFISSHIIHNCTHNSQCQTCRDIQIAQNFLGGFGLAFLALVTGLEKRWSLRLVQAVTKLFTHPITLVSLKVKSNT
jgi:hypothetical protein